MREVVAIRFNLAVSVALVLSSAGSRADAQGLVPVNIYVADVTYDGSKVSIGTPRKLTGDRGINSQPSFTPDGRAILFVSRRDSANAQGDIYRIDLSTGAETRVTSTAEMENSPTVTPDGRLMVIRWTPATLFKEWGPWVYEMDGQPAKGVLPGPDTVGYYARVDSVTFAMMRPKARPAMAIFDARSGTMTDYDWPVANLPPQLIPGERAISYTRADSVGHNRIRRLDLSTRDTSALFPALVGRAVHVWTPGKAVLMGKGNVIYAVRPGDNYAVWQPVKKFSDPDLQSVTTYAMSPRGDKLLILSPLKPALHTLIRDSLQAGRSMSITLRAVPTGVAESHEISEGALIGIASEQTARGQPAASIELLGYVAGILPRSHSLQLELGNAYRRSGDEARALAAFRRSLDLNPRTTAADKRDADRAQQAISNPALK